MVTHGQGGKRFLSDDESGYTTFELELLAVAWAVNKCRVFQAGLQYFSVITDHNSLIPTDDWTKSETPDSHGL